MKARLEKFVRSAAIAPIRFYQRFISPLFPARCRYIPSCSQYAAQAVLKHGIIKGLLLAAWRILRCNPWSRGGFDRVPDKITAEYIFGKKLVRNVKTGGRVTRRSKKRRARRVF